jgi:hypothetical protein
MVCIIITLIADLKLVNGAPQAIRTKVARQADADQMIVVPTDPTAGGALLSSEHTGLGAAGAIGPRIEVPAGERHRSLLICPSLQEADNATSAEAAGTQAFATTTIARHSGRYKRHRNAARTTAGGK